MKVVSGVGVTVAGADVAGVVAMAGGVATGAGDENDSKVVPFEKHLKERTSRGVEFREYSQEKKNYGCCFGEFWVGRCELDRRGNLEEPTALGDEFGLKLRIIY